MTSRVAQFPEWDGTITLIFGTITVYGTPYTCVTVPEAADFCIDYCELKLKSENVVVSISQSAVSQDWKGLVTKLILS